MGKTELQKIFYTETIKVLKEIREIKKRLARIDIDYLEAILKDKKSEDLN